MDAEDNKALKLLEKIDKYLNGELDEKERQAFEAEINADKELAKEVEMNRIVNEALKNKDVLSFKEDILETMAAVNKVSESVTVGFDEIGRDHPKKYSRKIGPTILGIAATVLLLIAAVFVFRHFNAPTSVDSLVADYLDEPYKGPPFYRGPEETIAPWVINYEKGDYQEAKTALEKIVASGGTNPEASFYLGLCYLYQENPDPQNAVSQFNKVLDSDNRYREQALWYLGLAYTLADQHELAAETLRNITGFKQKEANALLEKME
ncbi:MAG: tetratricopeptide repeat protein [Anditalea sp.]